MKVRSSALPVDDDHTIIVQILTMMMTIVFVIYVHRPNHVSSALPVDDDHTIIVQILTMMMTIVFVIYVHRPNHVSSDHHHIISWLSDQR